MSQAGSFYEGSPLPPIETLTGNAGGAIGPDAAFNINIVGTATNGINVTGAGNTLTVGMNSPYSDGNFTFTTATSGTTRTLTVSNTANLAANSGANLQLTVGGAVSTGDPYVNFLVTGAGTYSLGIDNSDADILKLTSGATPSTATTLMAWDAATPAINLYTYEYLINTTPSDAAGARASRIIAKGYQSGLEFTTLGYMEFSHSGAADDELGQWRLNLNDGNDGNAPINVMSFTGATLTVGSATDTRQVGISLRQDDNISSGWRFGYSGAGGNSLYLYCFETAGLSFFTSTVERWIMSAAGERTMPTQPAFLATHSVAQDNVTGAGTTVTANFTTEIFDQGADYDATNTFTAPITGRYSFSVSLNASGLTVAMTTYTLIIVTSNRDYHIVHGNPNAFRANDNSCTMNGTIFCDMDATDTAYVQLMISGDVVDMADLPADVVDSKFGGYLTF